MKQLLRRFYKEENGQDLVEYALMAAFVAVVAGAVMPGVAHSTRVVFAKLQLLWQGTVPSITYIPPPTWGAGANTIRIICAVLAAAFLACIVLKGRRANDE